MKPRKGARTAALACLSRLVHKAMSDHIAKPRRTTGQRRRPGRVVAQYRIK